MPRKRKRSQPHRNRHRRRACGFGPAALHVDEHIAAMNAAARRIEVLLADTGLDPAERYRKVEAETKVCVDTWLRIGELARLRPKLVEEGAIQTAAVMARRALDLLDELREAARAA